MKVLVIGGSGFIGTRLVSELLVAGHEVKILDISKSEKYPSLTQIGDVRNLDDVIRAVINIDLIYNLAAEHKDDVTPISLYHDVNVFGAENIIKAAEGNHVQKIIFTSTVAVYGLNKNCPDETFTTEPFNEYGRTKLAAENIFRDWASALSTRSLTIIRPAVVFGESNKGNVHNLITQIKSGRFILIGDGKNKKSMGYVGNISHYLSTITANSGLNILNFCDKPDLNSAEIASIIATNLDRKLPKYRLPLFLGMIAGYILDIIAAVSGRKFPVSAVRIKKFAAETTVSTTKLISSGYIAKYPIEEGLRNMIESDFK